MVIAVVTPWGRSAERVIALVEGRLAPQVATSTIAADIATVDRVVAGDPFWKPKLAEAQRLLRQRRDAERDISQACRVAAQRRYLANRAACAEENRMLAKAGGSGTKQKRH